MQSAAIPTSSTFEDGRDEPRLRREPDVRDARCAVAGDNTVRALRAPPMPGAPIAGVASGTARVLVTIQARSARPPGALGTPWRAPVGLDHQPHREEKDELRGAIRAAVVTPNPRGAGRDMTQSYDGAVAAVRAPAVAGFWEGQRGGIHDATLDSTPLPSDMDLGPPVERPMVTLKAGSRRGPAPPPSETSRVSGAPVA